MAIDANSTTVLAALLSASIASVASALERTHTVLARHGAAPIDTLEMLYLTEPGGSRRHMPTTDPRCFDIPTPSPLPPLGVALSRRRDNLGSYDGEVDHG